MQFKNKVALITGSGSGIGRVTALQFAAEGATIVVSDINEKSGAATVHEIEAAGGKAIFIKCNVAVYEEVEQLMNTAVEQLGQIDIAVNNAGIGTMPVKTEDHSLKEWDRVIAVNQTGLFYCMKLEIQQMLKQGSGCIVNIASIAGLKGLPNNLAYVASKHAVVGMTKTAAMEYAKHNIRINAVCPVFTITNLFKPEYFGEVADKLKNLIPMKRFAEPQEMAEAIVWLSSDKASFVTGHAMPIDGGITA